ncbi:methyltransferase domain-containing protein [Gemelliphila palaticanis]|uniref:Methyltransferase domain-containing protein n=1 Tax=Gemelliphila palaticanis TaxID=81950 RepID=A0ABX2T361_9BACL|nr:methyltransferase domain-containing protein [Gemella palaticanis]MBF0715959.1 methyltransferase domain-containing protein [Gemella palaticanis]NYS47889.1 methyltransferase domain-containing protein [Gemella palaticanis]
MKIENVIKKFSDIDYKCPHCGEKSKIIGSSLLCSQNHSYDFSKKGYIHLIANYKPTKYSKELFEARSYVFENGYYEHIVTHIKNILEKIKFENIVDIGCGEGYYIKNLKSLFPEKYFYGLDNSKDAIELAVKEDKLNPYMLANLANIPFYNDQIDAILNILTPANYDEFSRILKKDGLIIKVIPTNNYLKEIRELFNNDNYSNEDTINFIDKYCNVLSRDVVSKSFNLKYDDAKNFLNMTPLTFSKEVTEEDIKNLKKITIELEIIVAKKKIQ